VSLVVVATTADVGCGLRKNLYRVKKQERKKKKKKIRAEIPNLLPAIHWLGYGDTRL
jgi:hypothetical protein